MSSCLPSGAGTYIDGGDGDDKIIITGDHPRDRIVVEGGNGQDQILYKGGSTAAPVIPKSLHSHGFDGTTLIILATIMAVLMGVVILRFSSR